MIDSSPWITPLLLMPGVALLILSTAVRYNRLHDEVHNAGGDDVEHAGLHQATLAFRARRFCNALVGLYLAVSLIALAALSGVTVVVGLKFGFWGRNRTDRTVRDGNPLFQHTVDSRGTAFPQGHRAAPRIMTRENENG